MTTNETGHKDWVHEWLHLPLFNVSNSFEGTVLYDDLVFVNFESETTSCGSYQAALAPYWKQANYVPLVRVKDPTFVDVKMNALARFTKPLPEWAIVEQCGNFPCTALLNSVALITGG